MRMKFVNFSAQHFEEYQAWFADPTIRKHLGEAVTPEWLDFVIKDKAGQQLCVLNGDELVAVVGIVFPTQRVRNYVVSDIAIRPELRGAGIGRFVVESLLARFGLASDECWEAYVDQENSAAFSFFQAINWRLKFQTPDQDGMFVFTSGGD